MIDSSSTSIFDHAGTLERMGHDPQLFRDMVGYVGREGRQWLQELTIALEAGELSRVLLRAHSLKGLVANFGEGRAWLAAFRMEELAKARQCEQLSVYLPELKSAFDEFLSALKSSLVETRFLET